MAVPPYRPELNPVERVWLHLCERLLSLRRLADYDTIAAACCTAWMALTAEPETLKSLCNYPWIRKVAS